MNSLRLTREQLCLETHSSTMSRWFKFLKKGTVQVERKERILIDYREQKVMTGRPVLLVCVS